MKIGLLGRKVGMTRVYDANGKATAVTVIEAGGNTVVQREVGRGGISCAPAELLDLSNGNDEVPKPYRDAGRIGQPRS